jgi:hypothetical protein
MPEAGASGDGSGPRRAVPSATRSQRARRWAVAPPRRARAVALRRPTKGESIRWTAGAMRSATAASGASVRRWWTSSHTPPSAPASTSSPESPSSVTSGVGVSGDAGGRRPARSVGSAQAPVQVADQLRGQDPLTMGGAGRRERRRRGRDRTATWAPRQWRPKANDPRPLLTPDRIMRPLRRSDADASLRKRRDTQRRFPDVKQTEADHSCQVSSAIRPHVAGVTSKAAAVSLETAPARPGANEDRSLSPSITAASAARPAEPYRQD